MRADEHIGIAMVEELVGTTTVRPVRKLDLNKAAKPLTYVLLKRLADISIALVALAISLPLMVIVSIALNCALIKDATNWDIGKKEPLKYLAERCKWASEEEVRGRLASHLIPIEKIQCGGYDDMEPAVRKEAVAEDYDAFVQSRAEKVRAKALELGGFKAPASESAALRI